MPPIHGSQIMDLINLLLDKGPGIIALGSIAYWLYRTLVIPVAGVGRKMTQVTIDVAHLKTDFVKTSDEIVEIRKELKSNGGGSLKDAVKRVEFETVAQNQKLAELAKGHIEIKAFQSAQAQFMTPRIQAPLIRATKAKK